MIAVMKRWVQTHSLLRNSLYIMAATAFTSALGYGYWVYAARRYPDDRVGVSSALIGAMILVASLSNFGIGTVLIHRLPHRASGHEWSITVNTAFLLAGVLGLIGAGIAGLVLLIVPQFQVIRADLRLLIFVVSVPLWTCVELLNAIFIAERKAQYMLVVQAAFAVGKLALLIAGVDIFASWVVMLPVALVIGVALLTALDRGCAFTLHGWRGQLRPILAVSPQNHLINVGAAAPAYLLPLLVTVRLSPADNAYFYMAWQIRSVYSMISVAVATSLFAEGVYSRETLAQKTQTSAVLIAALLGPMIVILLVGGQTVLDLFGRAYAQRGLETWTLLVISAVPDAITNIYTSVLRVQHRLDSAVRLNLGIALAAVSLAWLLLPHLGIAGAAWAWLIAQSVGSLFAVSQAWRLPRRLFAHNDHL
jgi:O-antigen/teichoic acid export membrane protein